MATHWSVGDTVLLELKYYVYALLGDDDEPFYVGMTCHPAARLKSHARHGVPAVKEALAKCAVVRMRILAGPMTETEAARVEKQTIKSLPNLLNHHGAGRDIERLREKWRRKMRRRRARLKLRA